MDVLAESGFLYDSSIYPVRHDRYGIPTAPRGPFLAEGREHAILEIPPATVRLGGMNLPIGGGGYFRLLPTAMMHLALALASRPPIPRDDALLSPLGIRPDSASPSTEAIEPLPNLRGAKAKPGEAGPALASIRLHKGGRPRLKPSRAS